MVSRRAGFTLLEVILALALSTLLVGMIVLAVRLNLRLLDAGREEVEEAQLARALLTQVASDLRGAVAYNPLDAASMLPDTMGDAADLADAAADAGLDTESLDTDSLDTDIAEDRVTGLADSAAPRSKPGLFGNQYELQVDVARLPRMDQLLSLATAASEGVALDVPTDVKTVLYYVAAAPSSADGTVQTESDVPTGLFRVELDRAMAAYASDQGTFTLDDVQREPIASEVAAVEFRYYDGYNWQTEWDSIEYGGLPMAVEVAIAMQPKSTQLPTAQSAYLAATPQQVPRIYRLLVHLPVAEPIDVDSGQLDTSTDETDSSSSSSDSGFSGGSSADSSDSTGGG